jgi:putative pyruvate formate lyase activating enzyme
MSNRARDEAGPGYTRLVKNGELQRRARAARDSLASCTLCPRRCRVDRTAGELGYCKAGETARVYRHMVHHGEEPPISCGRGSGAIFWSHCTMACCYCQNYRMSCRGDGTDRSIDEVAQMIMSLEEAGCHNINMVSPTHFTPHILDALLVAAERGASLPIVWNTSGYESQETLNLLDGVVDIYLCDIRYGAPEPALAYSDAADYVEVNRAALIEMTRQVGELELNEEGAAVRGLIVRHLVLPNNVAGTAEALRFVSDELGSGTHVSLMAQYYPTHLAGNYPELARRITREEWREARQVLSECGLENGWIQQYHGGDLSPIAGTEIEADA